MHQRLGTQPTAAISAAGIRGCTGVCRSDSLFSGQAYAGGMCPLSCRRQMARKAGPLFVFL